MKGESQPLREMEVSDLEMVLRWRNHPKVRCCMFSSDNISDIAHERWFEVAHSDSSRHLFIYQEQGESLGFLNFSRLETRAVADWGFYLSPEAEKGMGKRLCKAALEYAFNEMNLYKICGQVLAFNEKSIALHKRLGFKVEGVLRQQHCNDKEYIDVILFGLLQSEWLECKKVSF